MNGGIVDRTGILRVVTTVVVAIVLHFPVYGAETVAGTTTSTDAVAPDLAPQTCEYVAHYSQTREVNAIPVPLKSNGDMLYACNQGLIWQTSEPLFQSIVYTTSGENFRIDADDSVKLLNDLVNNKMAALLLAMMGGDYSGLEENFNLDHKPGQTILTPRDDTTARFIRQIEVATASDGATITLTDGSQQQTIISIGTAKPLDDIDLNLCTEVLDRAEVACQALLSPGQVAAGLVIER